MDEIWTRVIVVSGVVIVALSWSMIQRRRSRGIHEPTRSSLEPGIYLFSSKTCSTCPAARSEMVGALGAGFSEIVWEEDPELFELAGVDSVPAVMIVDGQGGMRLKPGHPEPSTWQ